MLGSHLLSPVPTPSPTPSPPACSSCYTHCSSPQSSPMPTQQYIPAALLAVQVVGEETEQMSCGCHSHSPCYHCHHPCNCPCSQVHGEDGGAVGGHSVVHSNSMSSHFPTSKSMVMGCSLSGSWQHWPQWPQGQLATLATLVAGHRSHRSHCGHSGLSGSWPQWPQW